MSISHITLNTNTNLATITSSSTPSPKEALTYLFKTSKIKLHDLATATGKRQSQIFKAMFDSNTTESDNLLNRIVVTGNDTWEFNLAAAETPDAAIITPDTAAPTVASNAAIGVGNLITITCSDTNNLSVFNTPDASAFTVTLNGTTADVVTNVSIPRNSKNIKLTLTTALISTDTATVTYTKPTAEDAKLLQDTAGNAVATFTSTVTNNTPAS